MAESTKDFLSFDFGQSMRDVTKGMLIKPILQTYLFDAKFPAFDLHFEKEEMERAPDGWFHPSTHPMMPERALYQYLAHPETFPIEKKQYFGTLSVTMGKITHEFVQMCLKDAGVLPPEMQVCTVCPPERGCREPGFEDPVLGERGHVDGLADFAGMPSVPDAFQKPVFEFKCLAPEVPISMADGSLRPAGEIREGDWILGWDEDLDRCVPRQVERVWDNGVVPVWTVTTKAGRSLGVTDEHPFLTRRGWVFARDLRPGDVVKVAWGSQWFDDQEEPYWSGEEQSPEWDQAHFFGVMIGDGCLTGSGVMLSCADNDLREAIHDFVEAHGCSLRHVAGCDYSITAGRKGRYRNPVREMLRIEGMLGTNSRTKRVPPTVWTGGPAVWAGFLSGYFDADGTVVTRGSYPHLSWASVNRPLLVECQTLLAYLGVRSSIMEVRSGDHLSWRLLVRDRRAVNRAVEVLSSRHHQKQEALAGIQYPEREDGKWVRKHQQGWDSVSSVSVGLARPTVAIEVCGGTHITAGLVTHNTSHDNFGRLSSVDDLDLAAFRKKWPYYWSQQQRYQRQTGRRGSVVIFMEMSYPWVMREFHVPYDVAYNAEIDAKYRRVRQAVADQAPPICCGLNGCASAPVCRSLR